MKVFFIGGTVFILFFSWVFCAAADYEIGIDEDEEQAEWLRNYEEKKLEKMKEKGLSDLAKRNRWLRKTNR